MSYVKIGVAGPVGSGKTALIEALSRKMANDYSIGVITNDIYTKEDAQFLAKNSVLPLERIIGVETGGCPHTAIREDASMNLEAVDEMMERFPDIELLLSRAAVTTSPLRSVRSLWTPRSLLSMSLRAIRFRGKAALALHGPIFSSSTRLIWLRMSVQA